MMEDIQAQYDVSEYSVTQTTLEQIFNAFALQSESAQQAGALKKQASVREPVLAKPSKSASPPPDSDQPEVAAVRDSAREGTVVNTLTVN